MIFSHALMQFLILFLRPMNFCKISEICYLNESQFCHQAFSSMNFKEKIILKKEFETQGISQQVKEIYIINTLAIQRIDLFLCFTNGSSITGKNFRFATSWTLHETGSFIIVFNCNLAFSRSQSPVMFFCTEMHVRTVAPQIIHSHSFAVKSSTFGSESLGQVFQWTNVKQRQVCCSEAKLTNCVSRPEQSSLHMVFALQYSCPTHKRSATQLWGLQSSCFQLPQ